MIQVGDVVKIVEWTGETPHQKFVVIALNEYAELAAIEHFPSRDYPRGKWSYRRTLPTERCTVDQKATRQWNTERSWL